MNKSTLIALLILISIAFVILFFGKKQNTVHIEFTATTTPIVEDIQPQQMTIKGTYIGCLPKQDNFSSEECVEGVLAEDGAYYALDLNLLSQTRPTLKNDQMFMASGIFTPIEMLSGNRLQGTAAKGIFSATIITPEEVIVSKPPSVAATPKPVQGKCFIGGCSSQICSDRQDIVSTCEYTESYACYQGATCERQTNGACGWTQTAELKACLAK